MFCKDGTPHAANLYGDILQPLHDGVLHTYDESMEIDRNLSLKVLDSLPVSATQVPGSITQVDKEARIIAVNALAARPLHTIQALMSKDRKLQSLFSDKPTRVSRHNLMTSLPPEDVIRTYSASDKGAAPFQVQPTSPNLCFLSMEFQVLLFLRLVSLSPLMR